MTRLGTQPTGGEIKEAIVHGVEGILEVDRFEAFKKIPGHERHYVPRSEYIFKTIQPKLEDILYLGKSYEDYYDQFEILLALVYADLSPRALGRIWGPPGRFAWKQSHRMERSPFNLLFEEAKNNGSDWPPLKAGLFGGSIERFLEIAKKYRDELLNKLGWF